MLQNAQLFGMWMWVCVQCLPTACDNGVLWRNLMENSISKYLEEKPGQMKLGKSDIQVVDIMYIHQASS